MILPTTPPSHPQALDSSPEETGPRAQKKVCDAISQPRHASGTRHTAVGRPPWGSGQGRPACEERGPSRVPAGVTLENSLATPRQGKSYQEQGHSYQQEGG